MRRNRKMPKKMSVMAGRSVQIGAVMVMAFAVVILYMLASSSCKQLEKTIREKERQLAKLEDEQRRESMRWEEMKTPKRLESALLGHGLAMKLPKTEQVVRMRADGADGIPVPDYVEENVSDKVVRLIQSYTNIVNRMVWRKA